MSFLHHRKLTFANNAYEEFTNFPVLIKIDDSSGDYPDLDAYNNISFHDSDGTRLSWGCKEFNTGGVSYYIVKCINIAKSDTDYIDVYYGGDTTTEDKASVCDANTVLMTPMVDEPDTSHIEDWTGVNDGTKKGANEPVEAAGGIGLCQDFDGTDDYINVANDASINPTDAITVECYYKLDTYIYAEDNYYVSKLKSTSPYFSYTLHAGSGNTLLFRIYTNDGNKTTTPLYGLTDTTSWHYIVGTYDGSNLYLYTDGVKRGELAYTGTIDYTDTGLLRLNYASHMEGKQGLVRISNTARSLNWLKAQDKILRTQDYVTFGDQVDQIRAPHIRHNLVLIKGKA